MLVAVTATDAHDSLGRASALMASGSLVSRVLGVVRNALLGFCIGGMAGTSTAFQTANTLPNTIFMLLQSGVLTAILIPQITRALRRDDGGTAAIDSLLTLAFGVVGVVTIVVTALAGPLITLLNLRGTTRDLGIAFAYLCLPQVFFYAAYAIWSQVLNVKGRFGITMWTPALANLIQIVGMGVFLSQYVGGQPAERWTPPMIWLLAGTSTLGIVVQALALLPALRGVGYRWRPNFRFRGHGFRASGRVAGWMIAAVVIAQGGGLVTQAAINAVSERAREADVLVAGLNVYTLAFTIFMVPHGIVTVSILTALLPRMTSAAQRGDTPGLRADVVRGLQVPLLGMVPLTFAAVALADPGCALLNPGLDDESVRAIALTFSLMAFGLVPYAIAGLQQRFNTAREDGRTYLVFQVIVTVVQLVAAGLIIFLPDALGVPVVALGQSLGNALAAAVFLVLVQRQLGGLPLRGLAALSGRLVLASAVPGFFAWLVVQVIYNVAGDGLPASLAELAAGGLVFGLGFVAMARLLDLQELSLLLGRHARRFLRYSPRHGA